MTRKSKKNLLRQANTIQSTINEPQGHVIYDEEVENYTVVYDTDENVLLSDTAITDSTMVEPDAYVASIIYEKLTTYCQQQGLTLLDYKNSFVNFYIYICDMTKS